MSCARGIGGGGNCRIIEVYCFSLLSNEKWKGFFFLGTMRSGKLGKVFGKLMFLVVSSTREMNLISFSVSGP